MEKSFLDILNGVATRHGKKLRLMSYEPELIKEAEQIFEQSLKGKEASEDIVERGKVLDLLDLFCKHLEKGGYLDADFYSEPPSPIDEFMKGYPFSSQSEASKGSKPLSEITDEDIKRMCELKGSENPLYLRAVFSGQPEYKKGPDERIIKHYLSQTKYYLLLSGKGYDLSKYF